MITKVTSFGSVLAVLLLAFGCGQNHNGHDTDDHHAGATKDWKEMDHFHMVMAEAFHPYKDSLDLQPAKEKAQELATAAKDWKNSEAPEGLDKDKLESNLDKL